MGRGILSKSLIQFSIDGLGCVSFLLFDLRPNYSGGNEDHGDLLQKVCACTVVFSAPDPETGHCQPTPPPETLEPSWESLDQSLAGSLLLSPGSWCTQGFVCPLQESVSPSCVSSVIKSHWPPSQIAWGFSAPLSDPQVGKSVVGPRILTMQEFIWYNCSALCGSFAQQLYGRVTGDLLQEGLCTRYVTRYAAPRAPAPVAGHCWPVSLQETLKNTQRQVWLSLCGFSGSWAHKILFEHL